MLKLPQVAIASLGLLLAPLASGLTPSVLNPSQQPLALDLIAPAQAQNRPLRYVPPDRGAPRRTQGAGSRGCQAAVPVALTLLVPSDHIGLTAASHPSFFWHINGDVAVPVEFTLTEPGQPKPLLVQQLQANRSGIFQVQLPQNQPGLVPGRDYRWSVTLVCNPNRPSANIFAQSWIQRVASSAIATKGSDYDQALQAAQAGLWYDALAALLRERTIKPTDPALTEALLSLFHQGGLTQVELLARPRLAKD